MFTVWTCGRPVCSNVSAELRRYGCRRTVPSAGDFWTNVTPTDRGPALIGTRTCSRVSISSLPVVGIPSNQQQVCAAADRREVHALAVDGDFELLLPLDPANRVQVGAKQLHLDDVGGVERETCGE